MRRLAVSLLPTAVLLLVACGPASDSDRDLADAPVAPMPSAGPSEGEFVAPPGEDAVMVSLDAGDGSEPAVYTLACPGAGPGVPRGSTLPDEEAACAHLRSAADPFAAVPADAICTQLFGGPQTAVIAGNWAGATVRLELSRTDGCRIAQWDSLAPLLPVDVG